MLDGFEDRSELLTNVLNSLGRLVSFPVLSMSSTFDLVVFEIPAEEVLKVKKTAN